MNEPHRHVPAAATLKVRRDATVNALVEHFSQDRLTVEEFEQRLDSANRATTLPDLDVLLSDLPALRQETQPVPAQRPLPPSSHATDHQYIVAIMSGVERRGRWQPAKNNYAFCFMGGGSLDFRDVMLPPGVTEVNAFCFMGGLEVIVPPDLNIDMGGFAIMGGFAHEEGLANGPADAPLLRINGFVLMGGVDLQVRLPGETAKDAKRRKKEERRERRDS